MMRLTHERRGALSRLTGDDWREHLPFASRERSGGPPVGWLIAGVVAVGLGFLAWSYLGPDLRRYWKIHSM